MNRRPVDEEALAAFQDAFAAALWQTDAAATPTGATATIAPLVAQLAAQPGFAVYRNTTRAGCVDALRANFPTVARLIGDEAFGGVAARFVDRHPPAEPSLLRYGAGFADFLADYEPEPDWPYLQGVARLDRLWIEAHVAADAPVLGAAGLGGRLLDELAQLHWRPHPAARWIVFPGLPARTIWVRNRPPAGPAAGDEAASEADDPLEWRTEAALLTRPHGEIEVYALGPGGCALLDACAAGARFEAAIEAAVAAEPDLDLAATMATLLDAGTFTALAAAGAPRPEAPIPGDPR